MCLPIGSGVQEAACKTLVVQRMKCSGISWRTPGGQAVLSFRALQHSGRSRRAWRVLGEKLRREIRIDVKTERKRPSSPLSQAA
jgi:hypothetical protein